MISEIPEAVLSEHLSKTSCHFAYVGGIPFTYHTNRIELVISQCYIVLVLMTECHLVGLDWYEELVHYFHNNSTEIFIEMHPRLVCNRLIVFSALEINRWLIASSLACKV